MTSLRSKVLSLIALPAFLLGSAACTPQTETEPGNASASASAPAASSAAPAVAPTPAAAPNPAAVPESGQVAAGTALEQLETLPIKGRAPKTGYDRDQFGPAWADVDRNGCDTRNDILERDLTAVVYKDGTKECVVASGSFADPYTGTTIGFVRGNETSTAVQIDHIVALSDAWQKGAQQLSAEERRQLANDPLNLMAADGPANGSKSDSDAASWLPPNKAFRCGYVALQTAVKAKYSLWMTQAEHDAVASVLSSCPDQPVPDGAGLAGAVAGTVAGAGAGDAAADTSTGTGGTPVYANCTAVKAAGVAPIRAGDAGWDPKFDGDGDGEGCTS